MWAVLIFISLVIPPALMYALGYWLLGPWGGAGGVVVVLAVYVFAYSLCRASAIADKHLGE